MHGPHPKDEALFREEQLQKLREAACDLRYLLKRGYSMGSSIELVGNRFQLVSRQRQSLFRAVFDPSVAEAIRELRVTAGDIRGETLLVDGHNVLITLETVFANGVLLRCDDGFLRDVAEKHGAYRQSEHTEKALEFLRDSIKELRPRRVCFYLDRPIPFSGLLAERMREVMAEGVSVEVAQSADYVLKSKLREEKSSIAATSDSAVLRCARRVFDLPGFLVETKKTDAWVVSLESYGKA